MTCQEINQQIKETSTNGPTAEWRDGRTHGRMDRPAYYYQPENQRQMARDKGQFTGAPIESTNERVAARIRATRDQPGGSSARNIAKYNIVYYIIL